MEECTEKERLLDEMTQRAKEVEDHLKNVTQLCLWLTLQQDDYLEALRCRLRDGTCSAEVEALLLRYALGMWEG